MNYTPGAAPGPGQPVTLEPGDLVIPTHMLDELRLQADGIARLHGITRPEALRWLLDRITTPLPAGAVVATIGYTDGTTEHRHANGTITRHP